jgi:hypothetical protein
MYSASDRVNRCDPSGPERQSSNVGYGRRRTLSLTDRFAETHAVRTTVSLAVHVSSANGSYRPGVADRERLLAGGPTSMTLHDLL